MNSIDSNNYREVDIKALAMDAKLGELNFEASTPLLLELRKSFSDLDLLNYKTKLSGNEVQQIDAKKDTFIRILNRIKNFSLKKNTTNEYALINRETERLYEQTMTYIRSPLLWLWKDAESESRTKQNYQEQLKEVSQLKTQSKELINNLQKEIDKLQKEQAVVESTRGEVAAVKFGKHFESQGSEFETARNKWSKNRSIFFYILTGLIGINIVGYIYLFVSTKTFLPGFEPSEFFTLEYAVAKISLLAVLSYAIGFASKNYNINAEQLVINKHRKNVAETLTDFLDTNPESEIRSEILRSGAEAMFKQQSPGYVKKGNEDGPVQEMVTKVNGFRQR